MALADLIAGLNRGFVTGLLGGPIDIANALLGGAGGQEPFMGSRYIGDKLAGVGLLPQGGDPAAEFVGGLLGPGEPFKLAAAAKGLLGGAHMAQIMFHGSPHVFDKFDLSKVGTGEGAQAFGHGVYLADAPEVANNYADRLSRKAGATMPGSVYKVDVPDAAVAKMLDWYAPLAEQPQAVRDAIIPYFRSRDLPTGIGHEGEGAGYAGRDLYRELTNDFRANGTRFPAASASEELARIGVPGIRYLDGLSIADGAGTHNTVLFDPSIATVLERNGQPMTRTAVAELTREFTPGDTTKHLPELLTDQQRAQQYADLLEPLFTGARGEDKIATALGAAAHPTLPNAGLYEGRPSPGFASQIEAQMAGNDITPASKSLLDAIAASHGLLATQKQSAYNVLTDAVPANGAFAVQFDRGAPYAGDAMRALQGDADAAVPGAMPMVDPSGARALIFGREVQPTMQAMAPVAAKYGATATPRAFEGNLFPGDAEGNPPATFSVKPYIEKIEAAGPNVVQAFNDKVAPIAAPMLERVSQFVAQHGLTAAPWVKPMLEGIAQGGLPRLKELVKAGVVPTALLAVGLSALPRQDPVAP